MPESWHPFAVRHPGPSHKTGFDGIVLRSGTGAVVHSAEGYRHGLESVLFDNQRRASWHFSVLKDGVVWQHYPREVITWHAGPANHSFVGIECEGVAGEPLTDPQLDALTNLIAWLDQEEAWPGFQRGLTLFEHNEFMSTSCPSDRIPWDALIFRLTSPIDPNIGDHATGGGVGALPSPTVERMLQALQAAVATIWTQQDFDHVPAWDLDVLRHLTNR